MHFSHARNRLRFFLLVIVTVLGLAAVTRGLYFAFAGEFSDGRARAIEYEWFKSGQYPNSAISGHLAQGKHHFSVYPPYSFPVFALFFEPAGAQQGVIVLSLLSLGALAYLGHASCRRFGAEPGGSNPLIRVLPFAVTGVSSGLALGQFSIICAALVFMQIDLIGKRRPYAAGICWALAMIKPQIGILFAPIFLLGRQRRGLVAGGLMLLLLSALACWWTDTAPEKIIRYFLLNLKLRHFTGNWMEGPGRLATSIGMDLQSISAVVFTTILLLMIMITRKIPISIDPSRALILAGAMALTGKMLLYNRLYDTIMLWPAVVSVVMLAARKQSSFAAGIALLLLFSTIIPGQVIAEYEWLNAPLSAIWITGMVYLFREGLRHQPDPVPEHHRATAQAHQQSSP